MLHSLEKQVEHHRFYPLIILAREEMAEHYLIHTISSHLQLDVVLAEVCEPGTPVTGYSVQIPAPIDMAYSLEQH